MGEVLTGRLSSATWRNFSKPWRVLVGPTMGSAADRESPSYEIVKDPWGLVSNASRRGSRAAGLPMDDSRFVRGRERRNSRCGCKCGKSRFDFDGNAATGFALLHRGSQAITGSDSKRSGPDAAARIPCCAKIRLLAHDDGFRGSQRAKRFARAAFDTGCLSDLYKRSAW